MDESAAVKRVSLKQFPTVAADAYRKLTHNDPLRMAGATAFFTSFALPFILIIITQLLSFVLNPDQLRKELFTDLVSIFGKESVEQMLDTLAAFRGLAYNLPLAIVGSLFLLMVATTLLMVVKGSINQLWHIKETDHSVGKQLRIRLQSVLIILATGVLVLISILAEAAKAHMNEELREVSATVAFYFTNALTYVLALLFVTLWFGVIFRLLPDGRPAWRVAFTGAFVTTVLFTIGRYLLRLLLTYGNLNSLYGASASVVLILLFVFYSSLIMYFGAAFTDAWANATGRPIKSLTHSTKYKVKEVEDE